MRPASSVRRSSVEQPKRIMRDFAGKNGIDLGQVVGLHRQLFGLSDAGSGGSSDGDKSRSASQTGGAILRLADHRSALLPLQRLADGGGSRGLVRSGTETAETAPPSLCGRHRRETSDRGPQSPTNFPVPQQNRPAWPGPQRRKKTRRNRAHFASAVPVAKQNHRLHQPPTENRRPLRVLRRGPIPHSADRPLATAHRLRQTRHAQTKSRLSAKSTYPTLDRSVRPTIEKLAQRLGGFLRHAIASCDAASLTSRSPVWAADAK